MSREQYGSSRDKSEHSTTTANDEKMSCVLLSRYRRAICTGTTIEVVLVVLSVLLRASTVGVN